jgi:hypothetical protein
MVRRMAARAVEWWIRFELRRKKLFEKQCEVYLPG